MLRVHAKRFYNGRHLQFAALVMCKERNLTNKEWRDTV